MLQKEVSVDVKINILDDELAVVTITGEVSVFDDDFNLLSKELMAYAKMGIYRFIIDIDRVNYIDSSGVGLIIRLATAAMKKDTMVCVICGQPNVLRVFAVSNVERIIKFVKSESEAVQYFQAETGLVLKS